MRRFFLIAGAMVVLMIMPQTTVWAEDAEFTPAQMRQIRKMFEEWSKQQRQQQQAAAACSGRAGHSGPETTAPKCGLPCRAWVTPRNSQSDYGHGILRW